MSTFASRGSARLQQRTPVHLPAQRMKLRLIDLDGSVACQPWLSDLGIFHESERADFRNSGPGLRVIATRRGIRRFTASLDEVFGRSDSRSSGKTEVFFYGSGDFHHLTAALVSRVEQPVTVIHFDNHPDWCRFPRTYNCGGWVNLALDMPHVEKVVTIGPCSEDLVRPELQTANLAAVSDRRLEVYPWRAAPSKVWFKYRDTDCSRHAGGHIHWRNLADESWDGFLDDLVSRLPQTALWITIDKDVLSPAEATTNWDQGQMTLDHITTALTRLAAARHVAGVDVCGEHSEPKFADPVRAAIARMDNPSGPPPSPEKLAINARTNARLVQTFRHVFG